ncbi:hypothetical protein ACF0H5_001010 [Mactra antiquata]
MHRLTEQRWAGFFWILLTTALVCQLIAFVAPAWLKIFIKFEQEYQPFIQSSTDNITTTPRLHVRPVNQDYSLWYMIQCRLDTWSCKTLSYYQIAFMDEVYNRNEFKDPDNWFLDRTNLFLDGVELRFDYSTLSENQAEYTFGMLLCMLAWYFVNRHKRRLVKKNLDRLGQKCMAVAAVVAFFSGLFVLIPVGRFGNMGDQLRALIRDNPSYIAVHKPIGLGFGAAGGTLALATGLFIALRITLRSHCPDCVDLPPEQHHDELALKETGNQVDNTGEPNSHA